MNVISAIIVDFRALDTVGEITVLFVAAVGVASLVLATPYDRRRRTAQGERRLGAPGTRRRSSEGRRRGTGGEPAGGATRRAAVPSEHGGAPVSEFVSEPR